MRTSSLGTWGRSACRGAGTPASLCVSAAGSARALGDKKSLPRPLVYLLLLGPPRPVSSQDRGPPHGDPGGTPGGTPGGQVQPLTTARPETWVVGGALGADAGRRQGRTQGVSVGLIFLSHVNSLAGARKIDLSLMAFPPANVINK